MVDLKQIFDQLDHNHVGEIEAAELKYIFAQLGFDGRVSHMKAVINMLEDGNIR